MKYQYTVEVDTDTQEHADQVISERVFYEEPYEDDNGVFFDYSIEVVDHPVLAVKPDYVSWLSAIRERLVWILQSRSVETIHGDASMALTFVDQEHPGVWQGQHG